MTTGQKIAAKRKELELSQEALGVELGVSRQTVYKWESDASLPEIDKLVALSRLFQVPVGWLLGVEEESPAAGQDFSPEQLKLLEEILGRYRQAEPETLTEGQREQVENLVRERLDKKKSKRRRWPWALAVLALVGTGWHLFSRLDQMERQYNSLGSAVGNIEHSVNSQISSVTDRVEQILKAQNELTADYGAELRYTDLADNTAGFSLSAAPKTYTPGMSVIFLADNGKETLEFPAQEGENGAFSAQVSCTLTDSITLSAVFVTGDTRQTQLLDQFAYLYSESFPDVLLSDRLSIFDVEDFDQGDGTFAVSESYVTVQVDMERRPGLPRVDSIQVGLFHNKKLVQWLEPCERPANYSGFEGEDFYHSDPVTLSMEEGDRLEFAARCTDQYGRAWMATDLGYVVKNGELDYPSQYTSMSDTAEWTF